MRGGLEGVNGRVRRVGGDTGSDGVECLNRCQPDAPYMKERSKGAKQGGR
jgi:hypothetical protein